MDKNITPKSCHVTVLTKYSFHYCNGQSYYKDTCHVTVMDMVTTTQTTFYLSWAVTSAQAEIFSLLALAINLALLGVQGHSQDLSKFGENILYVCDMGTLCGLIKQRTLFLLMIHLALCKF